MYYLNKRKKWGLILERNTSRKLLFLLCFLVVGMTVFAYIHQFVELAFYAPYYPPSEDIFSYFANHPRHSLVQALSGTFTTFLHVQIIQYGLYEILGFIILFVQRLGWLEIVLLLELLLFYGMKILSEDVTIKLDISSCLIALQSTILWSLIATVIFMLLSTVYHTSLWLDVQTFAFMLATLFTLTGGAILISAFMAISPIIKRRL